MSRVTTFAFRCNTDERRILASLAANLQRSQSDAVRWLIRNAADELKAEQGNAQRGNEKGVTHVARAT
jgi:hypothetical protein